MRRIAIRVQGQVQGVGFRPYVYTLALATGLDGWVRNDVAGVSIEIQGSDAAIDRFLTDLPQNAPPLAQISNISWNDCATVPETNGFRIIESSATGVAETSITPDAALCNQCLTELLDPANRRYRYAFINCTHCGPRYTLTDKLPYDRPNTSMAPFVMCERCQAEYDSPIDRRFHAQPNACPTCGPQLQLIEPSGKPITGDPIAETVALITTGRIVAVKGLGGFHLVCDARNADAVTLLRQRKDREEKPLAIMGANIASLANLVTISESAASVLTTTAAPIVLLRKRAGCDTMLPGIAPGLDWLGVMLPYTPLHHLLFHEWAGRPSAQDFSELGHECYGVMTSANPGGEPLVTGNDEARERLNGIADAILLHNRDILVRCDDSVVRHDKHRIAFVRRARGYTPSPIRMAKTGPSVLACGGWYKNTVCLTRGTDAYVSQHIGDLDNAATCRALEHAVQHLTQILQIQPQYVAHDLHPDFFSTRFAKAYAEKHGLPCVAIQHHCAHAAAVAAEHHLEQPFLALTLDGVGLGTNGSAWGGELLLVNGSEFERVGSLAPVALPGGDIAARQPWRMAAAALHRLDKTETIGKRFDQQKAAPVVVQMLMQDVRCPKTSSAGRLFDAAAGLLGIKQVSAFEAQAAMLLEGHAAKHGQASPLENAFQINADTQELAFWPLLEYLSTESDCARGAAVFHTTFATGLVAWVTAAARKYDIESIVLSGGCFLNQVLSDAVRSGLNTQQLDVYEATQVPPNDGGLSLGQAWVAISTQRKMNRVGRPLPGVVALAGVHQIRAKRSHG